MPPREPLVDGYGFPVRKAMGRHQFCSCEPPCQARFVCSSPHHKGRRHVPWCVGGDDHEDGEPADRHRELTECADCWCAEEARRRDANA